MIFGKKHSIRDVGGRSQKLLPHALTHVGQRRPLTLRRALSAALELVDILRDVVRLARMLPQVTT
jgi:hypothetical protein